MNKRVHTRTKPHLNIGTMGHIDHGKTTLSRRSSGERANPKGRRYYCGGDHESARRAGSNHDVIYSV